MKKTRILTLSFGILIAIAAKSSGAGNGCAWSGCQHLAFTTCLTEMTGVQGRVNRMKHKRCQIIGRKDYCCDEDCAYQACDVTCGDLGMDDFSHEVSSLHCDTKFGVQPTKRKHFCCGKRSYRQNNGFGHLNTEGSGFRTGSPNGGFRNSQSNDRSNQSSTENTVGDGSGFRTGSTNGGFRGSVSNDPSNQGSTDDRAEESGLRTDSTNGGFRGGSDNGGFRGGSDNGGFRGSVSSDRSSPAMDTAGTRTERLGFRN